MGKAEKEQRKLRKKKEKAKQKRYKKLNHWLDLCLIVSCFLAFLAAAAVQIARERCKK